MARKPTDSSSIAGQMALHMQLRLLAEYIGMDILLLLISIVSWCYGIEYKSTELNAFDPTLMRSLNFDTSGFPVGKRFHFSDIWDVISTGVYTFGETQVEAGIYIQLMLTVIGALAGLQFLIWGIRCIPEYFRAKRMLEPLNSIALATSELSEAAQKNEYNLDDIESAIGSIDPVNSDVHISTGNRDLKRLEKAINDLLDRMRQSYKSQTRFVSDASHELRTPIAVIQGYAKMLDRWGKSDEKVLEEGIDAIKKESENMNRLVEQLLFLARGDNGRQPVNMADFSLSEMITEVYDEAIMIDPDHEYNLDIKNEISVNADISMMKQTARILCDNAKKYTPKGNTITLRVKYNSEGFPSFEIQDTGIGIEEKDIPNIFDRFFRSDPARNRETGGTGLGLSIAKWIVDRHGGHFEVTSYKDIGTRISVCLPKSSEITVIPSSDITMI